MRGLIISIFLFSLLLITIISNYYFVNDSVDNMKDIANSLLPIPCEENESLLMELEQNFRQACIWLSLSVSHSEIEELTNRIATVQSANNTRNIEQFDINTKLLINSIHEIGRLEAISIKNIL